jgi:hypothetical protein
MKNYPNKIREIRRLLAHADHIDEDHAHDFRLIQREDKCPRHTRVSQPLMSPPAIIATRREYLRRLRAAELEAWTLSGSDCLLSRSCNEHVAGH